MSMPSVGIWLILINPYRASKACQHCIADFRRAVAAEAGEKIVFSWVLWPDRATCDASHEKLMADERMANFGPEMPFDGKRMVIGGFSPIFWGEAK